MSDLISRQAAIDAVRELYIQSPKINNDIVYDSAIDQAHDALVNLPSAQPEIVHCGDCKNADFSGLRDGRCYCMAMGRYKHENDYCSDGERE